LPVGERSSDPDPDTEKAKLLTTLPSRVSARFLGKEAGQVNSAGANAQGF
jgi:hypothetical protein